MTKTSADKSTIVIVLNKGSSSTEDLKRKIKQKLISNKKIDLITNDEIQNSSSVNQSRMSL